MATNKDISFWLKSGVWMFPLNRHFDNAPMVVNLYNVNLVIHHLPNQAYVGVEGVPNPMVVRMNDEFINFFGAFENRPDVVMMNRFPDGRGVTVRMAAIGLAVEHNEHEIHLSIKGVPDAIRVHNDDAWVKMRDLMMARVQPDYDPDHDDPIPF